MKGEWKGRWARRWGEVATAVLLSLMSEAQGREESLHTARMSVTMREGSERADANFSIP